MLSLSQSSTYSQRTPWGGGKKRGVENLTNDTPPTTGFWTPPRTVRFPPPLRCQCSVFPVQKSTPEQTRSSFGGVQKFSGERVLWYVFLPPYVVHPPHITAQVFSCNFRLRNDSLSLCSCAYHGGQKDHLPNFYS